MAVARHPDNIELQEEPNYENETAITARRVEGEMAAEGHYERLDLRTLDDAVYEDLPTKKEKDLQNRLQSMRRSFRVVAVSLGMLCLMMLGGNIGQAVHGDKRNMTEYNNLILERNQLQSEVNQLKREIAGEREKSCPSGWLKFGESRYYRSTEKKTWEESRKECLKAGADLVVINSEEEQEFIKGLTRDTSWIGLKRTEGTWTWVDHGTPLTTQYWAREYPSSNTEDCAYYHMGEGGGWFNGKCSSIDLTWICEKRCFS